MRKLFNICGGKGGGGGGGGLLQEVKSFSLWNKFFSLKSGPHWRKDFCTSEGNTTPVKLPPIKTWKHNQIP